MEFKLLGPLQVVIDAREVELGPHRQRLLLAVLLCRRGNRVSTTSLVDALWASAPPSSAADNIYLYIHRLRRILGADRITGRDGYALHAAPDEVDAHRFAQLAQAGQQELSDGDSRSASIHLHQALALWRGAAFAGLEDQPLIAAQAAYLDDQRLTALEHRIDADLALARHGELATELTGLTTEYPYRERFHAQRMLALYRSGRQAEALAAYRRLRTILTDDLGVDPWPNVQRLHLAMLRSDPSLDLIAGPAGAGRPGKPPAATSPAPPTPQQLPAAVSDFTGRAGELASLDELAKLDELARAGDRANRSEVVVITGTAGVGKTALALHWGHAISTGFPDGQLYANLRGYGAGRPAEPGPVLLSFLRALGAAEEAPAGLDETASRYRSALAGKRVLVLLDNAGSAEQVRPLLPGGPGCLVVVTSRDNLAELVDTDGTHRLTLDVLDPPTAVDLLNRLLGRDRINAELAAATELSRACDHLPLAIRIAAAHLADRPDRAIATQVAAMTAGARLDQLRVEGDESSAVRVAFHHSYAHLDPPQARLFRLLGLVPGPDFTVDAAGALLDAPDASADADLQRLATVHLIESKPNGRYTIHDLLREYAAECSETADPQAERDQARGRLYRFYLARSDAAARVLFPGALRLPSSIDGGSNGELFSDRAGAMAWLDAERVNLVAACAAAAEDPAHRELAWQLADALRRYLWHRSDLTDRRAVAMAGQTAAAAAGDQLTRAAGEIGLGTADLRNPDAVGHLSHGLELCRQAGWTDGEAVALGGLGIAYSESGQLAEAADHFHQAVAHNERIGRAVGLAINLGNLGLLQLRTGQFGPALEHLTRAVELDPDGVRHSNIPSLINGMGQANRYLGQLKLALEQHTRALAICRELGDINDETEILSDLAVLSAQLGQFEVALQYADAAVSLSDTSSYVAVAKALAYTARSTIRSWLGDHQLAVADGLAAVTAAGRGTNQFAVQTALVETAAAEQRAGHADAAAERARQAAQLADAVGHRHLEGKALTTLAAGHLSQGADGPAAAQAERALAIHRDTGCRLEQAVALDLLGQATGGSAGDGYCHQAVALLVELGITDRDQQQRLVQVIGLAPPERP
ncbi:MAG: tetratricopeptide repeat protein [Sporichthyaceae bacterium]|nr:tetratricopeptide repeat protein [Sporichthyaceae bacterium]